MRALFFLLNALRHARFVPVGFCARLRDSVSSVISAFSISRSNPNRSKGRMCAELYADASSS